jgi:hypothetical protein
MESIKLMHAIAGSIVGIAGLLQILLKKGGPRHRLIGQAYFWAWLVVVVTGSLIGSALIALLGVLGFYMALTGFRFGRSKAVEIAVFDKMAIAAALAVALGTLGWGTYLLLRGGNMFGWVALFFGVIFSLTAGQDFREFVLGRPIRKLSGHPMQWYFEHFGRMYISYIAAMTAFAVIQNLFNPALLNWILPTIIGTILLMLTNRRYFARYQIEPKK